MFARMNLSPLRGPTPYTWGGGGAVPTEHARNHQDGMILRCTGVPRQDTNCIQDVTDARGPAHESVRTLVPACAASVAAGRHETDLSPRSRQRVSVGSSGPLIRIVGVTLKPLVPQGVRIDFTPNLTPERPPSCSSSERASHLP